MNKDMILNESAALEMIAAAFPHDVLFGANVLHINNVTHEMKINTCVAFYNISIIPYVQDMIATHWIICIMRLDNATEELKYRYVNPITKQSYQEASLATLETLPAI